MNDGASLRATYRTLKEIAIKAKVNKANRKLFRRSIAVSSNESKECICKFKFACESDHE